MQEQVQDKNQDHLDSGLSGKNVEGTIGGEIMDVFFGAAVGAAFGVPTSFGPLDMGTAADMVDEYHKDKAREFELGQKSSISREFNFGGMRYNDIARDIAQDNENGEMEPSWRASNKTSLEDVWQKVPLQPNPEITQRAALSPVF